MGCGCGREEAKEEESGPVGVMGDEEERKILDFKEVEEDEENENEEEQEEIEIKKNQLELIQKVSGFFYAEPLFVKMDSRHNCEKNFKKFTIWNEMIKYYRKCEHTIRHRYHN